MEDRDSIQRNIAQYRALLRNALPRTVRAMLSQLPVVEVAKLARMTRMKGRNEVGRDHRIRKFS